MTNKTGPQLFATLGLFFVALAGSITFLGQNLEKIKQSLGKSENLKQDQTTEVPELYYKMVGNFPNFSSKSEALKQPSSAKYTVEIDHFHKQTEAARMLETLEKKGFIGFYTPLRNKNRVVYRVRQGVVDTRAEALRIAKELRKKTGFSGKVVKL